MVTERDHVDEAIWENEATLRPGMDFHNGKTFFTIGQKRRTEKPGKGKDADPILSKEWSTRVIMSDGRLTWYDDEHLNILGLNADPKLFQETSQRWELSSVRAFIDKQTTPPETRELFEELRDIYKKYVEFSDEAFYNLLPLYIMYTYVYRLFESTGYIHFNGTAASGKSRNLSILNELTFNSVWASSMSAASLYRKLAGLPGTTLLDESEGFEGERGEELRRILNAGYKEGATAMRTEKGANDKFMPVEYDVFGPKVLASINPQEPVIASRCIIVSMRPAIRQLPEFETSENRWAPLRNKLYLWAMANANDINETRKEWRDSKKQEYAPNIISRQWETSSQFIIMADYVGDLELTLPVISFFNTYYKKQQEAMNATDRIRTTLRCLPRVLATKNSQPIHLYSIKDIHDVNVSYMEADAAEYFKTRHISKNLDTLGFKDKKRASGGLRVRLNEDDVRQEFIQRQVEPFDEDIEWLNGTINYQDQPAKVIPVIRDIWDDDMEDPLEEEQDD